MREIKFRAWWRQQEKMDYPTLQEIGKNYSFPLYWCDLMQFTGLLDKNGKEIYEGDILSWWVSTTQRFSDELLIVKWGHVGWVLKSTLFKRFGVPADCAECSEINTLGYIVDSKVVGNIYENPDLLTHQQESR